MLQWVAQCYAYLQVLTCKLFDTLQHGAHGAPKRISLAAGTEVTTPPLPLYRDMWMQTHMFWQQDASLVIERLWVGSAINAADWAFLTRNNIRYIVNVSQEVPNLYEDRIRYCQVQTRDVTGCTLPWHWTSRFIRRALASGDGVLIHCFIGRSRSVAVACHFLMSYLGYSFQDAFAHLSRQRPVACLNADLAGDLAALPLPPRVLRLPPAAI